MTVRFLTAKTAKNKLGSLLNRLRRNRTSYLLTQKGKNVAALLPMKVYEELISDWEDRLDEKDGHLARDIAEARKQFKAHKSKTLKSLLK